MEPVEILKNIYWVGVIDWNIRDFHGYSVNQGTTYNSFLVLDEKVTLFDTAKKEFRDDFLDNIKKVVDPGKIDYIVVNHVEMDHSGSLPQVMDLVKPEKIFCSQMGKNNLLHHFHRQDWPYEVVKTGDSLSIGTNSIHFLETRMLHWPDSMFSYLPELGLLISSDAFGQHWATTERFDDQVDNSSSLFRHAAKYYANILLPYSQLVQKLLSQVRDMGLHPKMIAPDHGIIWRKDPGSILELYDRWSSQKSASKAIVVYDTMWHSTELMARSILEGLDKGGISVRLMDLESNHRSDVITEALDSKAIILGSSTLNNNILPRMADMLYYMKGLKPSNKIGAAFGSYGWSGEAVNQIKGFMEEMKFRIPEPGIRVQYVPGAGDLQKCVDLGQRLAESIKEDL